MSATARIFVISVSILIVLSLGWASTAAAQSPQEQGTTGRGRISDGLGLLQARDAAARAGLDCQVTAGLALGRDDNDAHHYEVSCDGALGYIIVDGARTIAHDCLTLASQNARVRRGRSSGRMAPACRLAGNRNPERVVAAMASAAGLTCDVDDAQALGRSVAGAPIIEVGCRGLAGAWIEPTATGWLVVDCIVVRSGGEACAFTTLGEELASLQAWLTNSKAGDCQVVEARVMGANPAGETFYELVCAADAAKVVALDKDKRLTRLLDCADADFIGDGCRLNGLSPRTSPPPPIHGPSSILP